MIRRPPRSTRTDTPFPYPTLFRSNLVILLACIVKGLALDLPALGPGQGPVVVEQGRLPAAVGGVGQHPPAFAEPVAVLVEQRGASGLGVVGDLDEIAELVAELHQHAVFAPGQAATALLLAAMLLAARHHRAQTERKSTRLNSRH